MAASGDVVAKTLATAKQYNDLRADVLSTTAGHLHDGVNGSAYLDASDLVFGTGLDAVIRWSTGDASNHALSVGLGDSNQALHITDKGAIATDWNIAATTHPNVYIHSNITPATDYLRLGDHDGTTAYMDNVGGSTLAFQIDGASALTLSTTTLTALGTATVGDTTQLELRSAAGGTTGLATVITFREGDGTGSANNMAYDLGYNASLNHLRLLSHDTDGASTDFDIWRVQDGQTTVDANTTWDANVFDAYDDAAILSPYREGQFNLAARREDLIRIGILKRYDDGWIGYNDQRMAALLAGGIYQSRARMDAQYEELDRRLKAIGA